jgi:hypothetical protein
VFPGNVMRAAGQSGELGPITKVIATDVNYGRLDVSGFDYQLSRAFQTPAGQWTPSVGATETYRYTAALVPGATPEDRVSRANDDGDFAPRWKGTAAIGWKLGIYKANVDARYTGRYQDYDSNRYIGNFWLYDANWRVNLGQAFAAHNEWLGGAFLEIGGVNLFNKLPQYSNFDFGTFGYDPSQGDIRGRFLYAKLGTKW